MDEVKDLNTELPGVYPGIDDRGARAALASQSDVTVLIGQRLKARVTPARFQGGTLNDLTTGGTITVTGKKSFIVKITTAGATDKIKYSTDNGLTWSAEIALTGAAQTLEDGVQTTAGATTGHALDDSWKFDAWPEPSVANVTSVQTLSDADAAAKFGYGSLLHRMFKAAFRRNPYAFYFGLPLDDSASNPTKGTRPLTFAGTATKPGQVLVHIGVDTKKVGYSTGDTHTAIAIAVQEAIAKLTDVQIDPAVDAATPGKVTLTARNAGTLAQDLHIHAEVTADSGITVTVGAWTNGTVDPDVQDALDVALSQDYKHMVSQFNDVTSLTAFRTHLLAVADPREMRPGYAYFSMTGTYAAATALASSLNSIHLRCCWERLNSSDAKRRIPHYELAAAVCATRTRKTMPNIPLDDEVVVDLPSQPVADQPSRQELEGCLAYGVTPLKTDRDGTVKIVRLITTYVENGLYRDAGSIETMDYVRRDGKAFMAEWKVGKVMTAENAEDALEVVKARALKWEADGLVKNVRQYWDKFKLEELAGGIYYIAIPEEIVEGLHQIRLGFLIQIPVAA